MQLTPLDRAFLLPPDYGLFAACHASTLVALPGGGVLAAFFAGAREGAGDTAIWLCRKLAPEAAWQAPVRLLAEPGVAHWNPVLHAEGSRVWLFYKVGPTVHEWTTRWAVSEDGGAQWSAPAALVPGDTAPRGPVKNKLIVLADGAWLAPASVETEAVWDCFTDRSDDAGRSWRRAEIPIEHQPGGASGGTIWQGLAANALWETDLARVMQWDGVIQPTLWESAPGHVHALMRSTRGQVWRSDSADGGRHWAAAYATTIPNNNSGIDLAGLGGGRVVLALNPIAGNWGRRTPLALIASVDNGANWRAPLALEGAEGEFSYPAIIATGAMLHVTYTWNRTNIVYHRVQINAS